MILSFQCIINPGANTVIKHRSKQKFPAHLKLPHVRGSSKLVGSGGKTRVVGNIWSDFDDWLVGSLHQMPCVVIAAHLTIVSREAAESIDFID